MRYRRATIASLICLTGIIGLFSQQAAATELNWMDAGTLPLDPNPSPVCEQRFITIRKKTNGYVQESTRVACVEKEKYFSLANVDGGQAVSFNGDRNFLMLANTYITLTMVAGTDRGVVTIPYYTTYGSALSVFDNIASRLKFDSYNLNYRFDDFSHRTYPRYDDNPAIREDDKGVDGFSLSQSGRYMTYTIFGGYSFPDRYVRVDLETGDTKEFGRGWYDYQYSPFPAPVLAISTDGQYVIGGGITRLKLWKIDSNCLKPVPDSKDREHADNCPSRIITPEDYGETEDPQGRDRVAELSFNSDDNEILFTHYDEHGTKNALAFSRVGM